MELVRCPHCRARVALGEARQCPSCRRNVDEPIDAESEVNLGTPRRRSHWLALRLTDLTWYGWLVVVISIALAVGLAFPVFHAIGQELQLKARVARGLAYLCAPIVVALMVLGVWLGNLALRLLGLSMWRRAERSDTAAHTGSTASSVDDDDEH